MKNRMLIIVLGIFTVIISCNKSEEVVPVKEIPEEKYCINYLVHTLDSVFLSAEDLNEAKSLFSLNQIDDHSLQIYNFSENIGFHVKCNQYVNGLKIFSENVIFHFNTAKKFTSISGVLVPQIILDTVPLMDKNKIIDKYMEKLDNDEFYTLNGIANTIKQGCMDIELGYFDLNSSMGMDEPTYIKAWKVNPAGNKYPQAYINDGTEAIIRYDNGMRE